MNKPISRHWFSGTMNDAIFIIDRPPYPAPDDVGPAEVLPGDPVPISWAIDERNADAITKAHNIEMDAANATIAARDATIARLREAMVEADKALRPFTSVVFNDNGDVSLTLSNVDTGDWLRIVRIAKNIAAALAETEKET